MGTALSCQGTGLGRPVVWGAGEEIRMWGTRGMAPGKGQNQLPHGFRLGCEVSGQLQPGEGRPPASFTELWTRELGLEVLGLDSPRRPPTPTSPGLDPSHHWEIPGVNY